MGGILDPDDAEWTRRAVRLDTYLCDTVFHLCTRIEFCDEVTGRIVPDAGVSIPMPDLPVIGTGVAASALVGREAELIRHYQRIFTAYDRHSRSAHLHPGSSEFRLQPAIVAGGVVVTDCAWYDMVPEAEALLEALIGAPDAPDGEIWDDLDQGWRLRVVRTGSLVCIAEWNWEDERARPSGFAFDSVGLAQQARAALARLTVLHCHLVESFGRDWWR